MSNNSLTSKKRLTWIDLTKGLAILGIVFFHFFQNYPDRLDWVIALDRVGAKIGYGAVDVFFVIAGFNISYGLALKAQKNNLTKITTDWRSWLIKRLNRLKRAFKRLVKKNPKLRDKIKTSSKKAFN